MDSSTLNMFQWYIWVIQDKKKLGQVTRILSQLDRDDEIDDTRSVSNSSIVRIKHYYKYLIILNSSQRTIPIPQSKD